MTLDYPDSEDRYSRQILFPGIGALGQQRLASAHAAIVGIGATGAATASLLARAGVGHLTLIDRDLVEPSNLQRQMLFDEDDARDALPKAEAARRHLTRINSAIQVTAHIADLVPANADELLPLPQDGGADLILDGTDNFETRYLLNDLCVRDGRPWIYAAALGAYAATMTILPKGEGVGNREQGIGNSRHSRVESEHPEVESEHPEVESEHPEVESRHSERTGAPDGRSLPGGVDSEESLYLRTERSDVPLIPDPFPLLPTSCLSCLFPAPPTGLIDTCDTAGILATAVNLAASLQATEALKLLTGQPHLLRRTLISYDLWTGQYAQIAATTPDPACEVCGARNFRHLAGASRPHITLCGRNSVQIHEHHRPLDLAQLRTRLTPLTQNLRSNGMLLRCELPPYTLTVFPDGRALIQGTTDIALARSLYARLIGS